MAEIAVLMDHYCGILQAEGDDPDSWIVQVHGSLQNYARFLEELEAAEEAVYLAAVRTVGTAESDEISARMQEMTRSLRSSAAQRIFSPGES